MFPHNIFTTRCSTRIGVSTAQFIVGCEPQPTMNCAVDTPILVEQRVVTCGRTKCNATIVQLTSVRIIFRSPEHFVTKWYPWATLFRRGWFLSGRYISRHRPLDGVAIQWRCWRGSRRRYNNKHSDVQWRIQKSLAGDESGREFPSPAASLQGRAPVGSGAKPPEADKNINSVIIRKFDRSSNRKSFVLYRTMWPLITFSDLCSEGHFSYYIFVKKWHFCCWVRKDIAN